MLHFKKYVEKQISNICNTLYTCVLCSSGKPQVPSSVIGKYKKRNKFKEKSQNIKERFQDVSGGNCSTCQVTDEGEQLPLETSRIFFKFNTH